MMHKKNNMEEYSAYKYFETFKSDSLAFAYTGEVSDSMITSSVNLLEETLLQNKTLKKSHRKLSFLIVESFQNVLRYGNIAVDFDLEYCKSMFLVRHQSCYFHVCSVNLIENKNIQYVSKKLCEVNILDNKALSQLYKETLTNDEFTKAGGAGLGFIEMVRKTKQKLHFDFVKINDKYSYFYLLIKSVSKNATPEELNNEIVNINWFKNFHKTASKNKLLVTHKGNFYPQMIEHLLNIIATNTHSDDVDIQQVVFNLILETLQNIHLNLLNKLDDKSTIFTVNNNGNYVLSTGKFIEKHRIENLKHKLDAIKNLSVIELKKKYEKLSSTYQTDANTILELVLMELGIETNNMFDYDFTDYDEQKEFQSFKIKF